jgi:L-ascorbate metabolism protein UlaG (beta-lactamase superfamily)
VEVHLTHLGTATVLLEIEGLRILTDPALDPPGGHYSFGFGTGSVKTDAPSLPTGGLGQLDAVLLTHDQHADNLDTAGRALLPSVKQILTTRAGARRLGANATGLAAWETAELSAPGGRRIRVTATPARHGPPLSLPVVGPVIGFALEWEGQRHGALYLSGDTVWFSGIADVARRLKVGTALLHLGGVRFGISGPLRYTFNGAEAVRAAKALSPRTIVPIHYGGWTHFREPRADAERAFADAGLSERVRWLPPGERVVLEV